MRFQRLDVTPQQIIDYADAVKAVGNALLTIIAVAAAAAALWKGFKIRKRRRAARSASVPPKFTKRTIAAGIIYLLGAFCFYYALYLGWGQLSAEPLRWYLAAMVLMMLFVVVNDEPIGKVDVLLLTSLVLVLIFVIAQLTFAVLQQVIASQKAIPAQSAGP